MKATKPILIILALISLFLVTMTFVMREKTSDSGDNLELTREETLGLIFTSPSHGHFDLLHLYKKSNISTKELLLKALAMPSLIDEHANIIRALGYIGDEKDVVVLKAYLNQMSGRLNGSQRRSFFAILEALGLMSRREIKSAKSLMDVFCRRETWRNVKFIIQDQDKRKIHNNENAILGYVFWFNRYLDKKEIQLKADIALSGITKPETLKYYSGRLEAKHILEHAQLMLKQEQAKITAEDRKRLQEYYHYVRVKLLRAGVIKKSETDLAITEGEVLKEFSQFEKVILNKSQNDLIDKGILLDNGKIISRKKLGAQREEYWKDLEMLERVFLMLNNKIQATDFQVKYNMELIKTSLNVTVEIEVINVTFSLEDSQRIVNKLFTKRNGPTFDDASRLRVVMKRVDGTWYWQPFGW